MWKLCFSISFKFDSEAKQCIYVYLKNVRLALWVTLHWYSLLYVMNVKRPMQVYILPSYPPLKQLGCKNFISCVACRKLHSVEFAEWGEKRERQLRIISFSAGFLSLAFTRFSFFTCLFSTGYPSQPVAEETQGWAEPLCRQNIIYKLLTKKDSPHHLRCKKS